MSQKKTSKKPFVPRFYGDKARLLIVLFAILASIIVIVASIGVGHKKGPQAPSATTLWPYGLPEYHVEVPEGYEDLLPGAAEAAAAQGAEELPGGAGKASASAGLSSEASGSAAGPSAGRSLSRPSPPPEYRGERARPFPVVLRQAGKAESISPTIIIVIDDAGYNTDQLEPFLSLPFPLTIAVLPGLGFSRKSAERVVEAGKELILHQPMEALGGSNPGPNALTMGMSPEEASRTVSENLDSLPGIVGMNNHMGSAATRDPVLMRAVLDIAKTRGIYYLDSLTSSGTATAALCRELEIPYWERDVFLDNSGDKQSILHALEEGKKTAKDQGAAVMIGHVWSAELAQTLMDIYPQLIDEGYSLSTISHYMIKSATGEVDAGIGD